jgi:hypothetical protein
MDANSKPMLRSLKYNRRYPHLPFGFTPAGPCKLAFDDPGMPIVTDEQFQRDVKEFEKLEEQIEAAHQVYMYLQDLEDTQRMQLTKRAKEFWAASEAQTTVTESSTEACLRCNYRGICFGCSGYQDEGISLQWRFFRHCERTHWYCEECYSKMNEAIKERSWCGNCRSCKFGDNKDAHKAFEEAVKEAAKEAAQDTEA